MIVLDTTVLLYAVGGTHPLRDPALRLVDAIQSGAVAATTTVEVVQEFAHVFGRRRSRTEATAIARSWATLLSPLLSPTRDDLDRGLSLFEVHPSLGAFDAVLAGTAIERGADALVSADRAFGEIPDLGSVDLAGPDLAALLSGA